MELTVKELQELLCEYPDNLEVKVSCNGFITPIDNVDYIYDIDTNKPSLNIAGYDKIKYKKVFGC
jgi:hypothetical protein